MKREPRIERGGHYIVRRRRFTPIQEEEYEGSFKETKEGRRKGVRLTRLTYSPETKVIVSKFAQNHVTRLAADRYSIPIGTIRRWLAMYNRRGNAAFQEEGMLPSENNVPKLTTDTLISEKKEENSVNSCNGEGNEGKDETEKSIKEEITSKESDILPMPNEDDISKGSVTKCSIGSSPNDSKLPNIESWQKINLVSPSLRLWAAKEAIEKGCKYTAAQVGVKRDTVKNWVIAYRTMGTEAHIFKTNVKHYSGSDNAGRGHGVCIYSNEFKKAIIDKSLVEGRVKVAYENGISPDTISTWKTKLNYRVKESKWGDFPFPRANKIIKGKKDTGYPIAEWRAEWRV